MTRYAFSLPLVLLALVTTGCPPPEGRTPPPRSATEAAR